MLDRGDYWQCAFVIRKGGFDEMRAKGLDAFRAELAALAPSLADRVGELGSWDDIKLLTVAVDRLRRWWRPGLLCIGDAAHAMSPIGGVGVNLAIQDAVATANLLAAKLVALKDSRGCPSEQELDAVRERRTFPVRMTQAMQVAVQNNLISRVIKPGDEPLRVPMFLRIVSSVPWLQALAGRLMAVGVRPEHVHSPAA
jgi:2-polyprenyl-6-methoxyphenol hydroxylase-like FAD-dependent oxidoreductase